MVKAYPGPNKSIDECLKRLKKKIYLFGLPRQAKKYEFFLNKKQTRDYKVASKNSLRKSLRYLNRAKVQSKDKIMVDPVIETTEPEEV